MRMMLYVKASLRSSKHIHGDALWALLRAPMSYFDTTIKGRIINRFSSDLQKVDMQLRANMGGFVATLLSAVYSLVGTVVPAPFVVAAVLPLFLIYIRTMNYYRASARELQRIGSQGSSPLYANFGEVLDGVATIRAYGSVRAMEARNRELLNGALGPYYLQQASGLWLSIRLQCMGSILSSLTAAILLAEYGTDPLHASIMGFALTQALDITDKLSNLINSFTTAETSLVAMERLDALCKVSQEPPLLLPTDALRDEAAWPSAASISFENVVMLYRPGLDPVLRGLTFHVEGGTKVGIVGRTGAGKSSVLVALFRLVQRLQQGSISIDGVSIFNVGLGVLRSRLSIIPQEPLLFSGTLMENLDPDKKYTRAELMHVINCVNLTQFVESRNGLEMIISPHGENLSTGQRQLLCLARAILRRSKIMVLDEATASVDKLTDAVIQKTLRELTNTTMLTIAHRLDTIVDYDKVLVMSEGKACEYDSPQRLLLEPTSVFCQMWRMYHCTEAHRD